jgi:uncharacterized membrane protein YhaH (DUF805 family)
MKLVSLLFDPRGRIDRRAFALGLLLLVGLSLATAALVSRSPLLELALVPILGELAVTALFHGPVQGLNTPTMAAFGLILAVRAYILACLCIKRLRDQGRTPDCLVVVVVVTLMAHVAAGAWKPDELDKFLPFVGLMLDFLGLAILWSGFLVWLAHAPTYAAARSEVKPAS